MKLLMIATGYPPYLFSENLCNGKLVMALMEYGIDVDVISRVDEGPSYGSEWSEPWDILKPTANIISYESGNRLTRTVDVLYSGLMMGGNYQQGIRWARRAYQKSLELITANHYDAILTRSPNDISHLVGEMLKRKTGIMWIANWNDPAAPIWPEPYKHNYSDRVQKKKIAETERLLLAADVNSFPSDSLRRHFTEKFPFLKNSRTTVFPHIGLVDRFWPKAAEGFNDGKLHFLHSGNLSAERNPKTTFKALRQLIDNGISNFEFHIMGHINDYTQSLIDNYQLNDYVKCIGSFPYMEALSKMQAYDVMVLLEAQLDRGIFFASKFTDYLQTCKPILAISPQEGFAADMLKDSEYEYLADNTNPQSILQTFKQIFCDYEAGKLNNTTSCKIFALVSPEGVVKKYLELLNSLNK